MAMADRTTTVDADATSMELDDAFDTDVEALSAVERAKVIDAMADGDRIPCKCTSVGGTDQVEFEFETIHGETFTQIKDIPMDGRGELHEFVEQFGYTVQNVDMMEGDSFWATQIGGRYESTEWKPTTTPSRKDRLQSWVAERVPKPVKTFDDASPKWVLSWTLIWSTSWWMFGIIAIFNWMGGGKVADEAPTIITTSLVVGTLEIVLYHLGYLVGSGVL